MAHIVVVGAGVVGTATGFGLHDLGHEVTFVDRSEEVVAKLRGDGHDAVLPEDMNLDGCEAVFVSVDTPTVTEPVPGIDLSNLRKATVAIGRSLATARSEFPVIVFRCTQLPGTTRELLVPLLEEFSGKCSGVDFGVAYWAEYLRAHIATQDFRCPRVITLGTRERHDRAHDVISRLAVDFAAAVHWLPVDAAEFQKYVHNVGNAIKISTYNWFRVLGEKLGIEAPDIDHVFELSALSAEGLWNPRYGLRNMGAYGGACLPKDIAALQIFATGLGVGSDLLDAAKSVNRQMGGP
jgi:UDP-glucose 6-dehydrogenase